MRSKISRNMNLLLVALIMPLALANSTNPSQNMPGLVVEVITPDAPAARAGLKVGDRILTYDGKTLASPAALQATQENTFGKEEVVLQVQRADQTLTLTAPRGSLGINARPELPARVLQQYEEGRTALQEQKLKEAIGRWEAAAKAAQEIGEQAAAAWLRERVGEAYESQRQWKEGIEARLAAWEILKQSTDVAAQSRTLAALGRASQSVNDFASAERWFEQARKLDVEAGYEMWVADDLNSMGILVYTRGNLQAAQDYFSQALAIRERLAPNSLDVANSFNNLGIVVNARSNPQAAQDYHSRALAINERLAPNSLAVAKSLNNLGSLAGQVGDLQAAQGYFSRALAIFERLAPDSLPVAASLNNLGLISSERGDLKAAQDYYSRALAIKERLTPNSLDVADSLNNLGTVAYDRGELQAALDYHHRALAIIKQLAPDSLKVAGSLTNLGMVFLHRGDFQAAQDYHSRALAIRERLTPNSLDIAGSLNNLGAVAYARGDLKAAQDYYSRALVIKEQLAPNSLNVAISLNNLGIVARDSGKPQAAQDYHSRALAIKERLAPNSLTVASSLANLGRVAYDRGDFQAAQDYHSRALAIKERLAPHSLDFAESLTDLGDLAFRTRRFSGAQSFFDRAVAIIEAQRSSISSAEARSLFFVKHRTPYLGLLQTYLALNDLPAAYATFERARARSLVDLLAERRLDFRADASADMLKQQDQLDQNRSVAYAALAKLNSEKDGKRIEELQAELTKYGIQQRELEAQFRRASPRFANLQYPEPLDLMRAQAALDEGTLLLAYSLDEKQTYLFALTNTSLKVFTLPIEEAELTKRVNAFRDAVSHKRLGNPLHDVQEQGRKLYDDLIRPAEQWVSQAKRILICPDGTLHTLPFAALISQTSPTVRYFIEDKPLHTIVSMTVYTETRKSAAASQTKLEPTLLAFGDAIYAKEQTALTTKEQLAQTRRRSHEGEEKGKNDSKFASIGQRGLKWTPLPGTRKEVEEIAKLYKKKSTVKLGQDVTKIAARQESPNYTILHFAVHGWLDDQIGLNSGIALSQPEALGKKVEKDDNGLWQAWEIIEQTRLKADLVVLSACLTGLGQELPGEGIIGLTRAFHYAGAKSVVVSLWSVSDASTAELMSAFHRELRQGGGKDVALQKAMVTVRTNPKWEHPYYWSAFVLSGDWK